MHTPLEIKMAIQIIITLHIIETIRLPPTDICDNVLINACVITHIHKLFEYANNAEKIKQFVNNPNKKYGTLTISILPSI